MRVGDALRAGGRADEAEIVETGVLMAADPALTAEIERAVLDAGRPAAVALVEAAEDARNADRGASATSAWRRARTTSAPSAAERPAPRNLKRGWHRSV